MHRVLTVLLIGGLIASAVYFVLKGLRQLRRTRALAGKAQEMGLQFSPDDPFDLPVALAGFALVSSGHSPRAENVIYGRLDGRTVRAFDFRYEVGHGAQRQTRHYSVITVEPPHEVNSMLMWHEDDAASAPMSLRLANQRIGGWLYEGSSALVAALAETFGHMSCPVNVQTRGRAAMLFMPAKAYARAYGARAPAVSQMASSMIETLARKDHARVQRHD